MRRQGLVRLAAMAGALLLGLAALKVVTGFGPSLPGPGVRDVLGLGLVLSDCPPEFRNVRLPPGGAAGASWTPEGTMSRPRDEPRAIAIGDRILVFGGLEIVEDGSTFRSLKRFSSYDPATGRWTLLQDLPRAIDHPGVVAHDGYLYLVGGFEDGVPSDAFLRYSLTTRRWTTLPPLPTPRGALGAAVVDGRIYAVGGAGPYDDRARRIGFGNSYRNVDVYDIRAGSWSGGPPLEVARNHLGVAALDGKIYAIGGRDIDDGGIDAVERLDPGRGGWRRLAPLPFGVSSFGLVIHGGRLVVSGGGDDIERWVTPATWEFVPGAGGWRRLPDLAIARHGHAAAVVGDRAFVFGGSPCAGFGITGAVESIELAVARG